jgi:hypothetical protein
MLSPQTGWPALIAGLLVSRYAFRLELVQRIARCGLAAIE